MSVLWIVRNELLDDGDIVLVQRCFVCFEVVKKLKEEFCGQTELFSFEEGKYSCSQEFISIFILACARVSGVARVNG
jgi:hypothetical protein